MVWYLRLAQFFNVISLGSPSWKHMSRAATSQQVTRLLRTPQILITPSEDGMSSSLLFGSRDTKGSTTLCTKTAKKKRGQNTSSTWPLSDLYGFFLKQEPDLPILLLSLVWRDRFLRKPTRVRSSESLVVLRQIAIVGKIRSCSMATRLMTEAH